MTLQCRTDFVELGLKTTRALISVEATVHAPAQIRVGGGRRGLSPIDRKGTKCNLQRKLKRNVTHMFHPMTDWGVANSTHFFQN